MSMEVKRYNLTVKENPFDGCPYADVHESDTGEYVEYAALRRAKAEVWREAAKHVLTCMRAVYAANDFDDRAAQIEEGE